MSDTLLRVDPLESLSVPLASARYFSIAGITVRVTADLPITDTTFDPKFRHFQVDGPGDDNVAIHHHFALPDLGGVDLGAEVYRRPPWAIYRASRGWTYLGIAPEPDDPALHRVATFSADHRSGRLHNPEWMASLFASGRLESLTLFPTDQILIARLLADREGCYLHSAGAILDGKGVVFVGHSEAGKSTTLELLRDHVEILCDDRNVVRRTADGYRVYGSWSHGDVPEVSGRSAPLRALLFLHQSADNRLVALTDRREVVSRLFACLIKPLVTRDWWSQSLALLEDMSRLLPAYELHFDRSGRMLDLLRQL